MPGKLVVLVRVDPHTRWTVAGAALSAAEAQDVVTQIAAQNGSARIVVANVIRSFVTAITSAEDAIPEIDP